MDWYDVVSGVVGMKAAASVGFSKKGVVGAEEDKVNLAFLASSAANEERTEVIMSWEEEEAASSLSATSAAMAAAVFLGVCPPFPFDT